MRNMNKVTLLTTMFALLIFIAIACSSKNENTATPADSQMSETAQSSSVSSSPSLESSTAAVDSSAEPAGEQAVESPSPSVSAEASHEHESSEPPEDKPSASESPKPASTPAPEAPSKEPKPSEPKSEASSSASVEPTTPEEKAETVIVEIKDFAFSPEEITIPKGSTVKFINRDKPKHTATADGGEFETALLGEDESEEVKFDTAGTFTYYCAPHPAMVGKIIVED